MNHSPSGGSSGDLVGDFDAHLFTIDETSLALREYRPAERTASFSSEKGNVQHLLSLRRSSVVRPAPPGRCPLGFGPENRFA